MIVKQLTNSDQPERQIAFFAIDVPLLFNFFYKRAYCMKRYLNILVSISIGFPAFVSFQAVADEPQQIPRIVVRPGPNPSGGGVLTGVGLETPVARLPPIEVRPRPENPDAPDNGMGTKPIIFSDLIKTGGPFCKKDDEVCGHGGWLSRMLVQCATYGVGPQGGCNSAVGVESQANDCRNTKPC